MNKGFIGVSPPSSPTMSCPWNSIMTHWEALEWAETHSSSQCGKRWLGIEDGFRNFLRSKECLEMGQLAAILA
jgi:hypothetical protein